MGIKWQEPLTESAKEECSGWLIDNNTKIYIRDSKDLNDAVVDLNMATDQLNKLMDYKSEPDTAATFAAQSAYVFPRPTDPTKHITNNSYRKKLYKFNYKFGLAERSLVRSFGSRKLYTYKNIYSFKHLRKTFATIMGLSMDSRTSERMRHSSTKLLKIITTTKEMKNLKVDQLMTSQIM